MLSVTQEERERAVFRSRRMYQTDMDSNMATAMDRGRREGRAEEKLAIAQNMMKDSESIDKIMRYTGLTREEVENGVRE